MAIKAVEFKKVEQVVKPLPKAWDKPQMKLGKIPFQKKPLAPKGKPFLKKKKK